MRVEHAMSVVDVARESPRGIVRITREREGLLRSKFRGLEVLGSKVSPLHIPTYAVLVFNLDNNVRAHAEVVQSGRTRRCHRRGQGFESLPPHHDPATLCPLTA
jgi:hypothetical protein